MGYKPTDRYYSLERIKNHLGYSPKNCRWATGKEQGANRRSNRVFKVDGVSKTIEQWAEFLGVTSNSIRSRLKWGWSIKRAVTTPSMRPDYPKSAR